MMTLVAVVVVAASDLLAPEAVSVAPGDQNGQSSVAIMVPMPWSCGFDGLQEDPCGGFGWCGHIMAGSAWLF
jgi:hypothetical protein